MAVTPLSNSDVISLLGAGLDPATVIGVIYRSTQVNFDISVQGMVALGQAKVPDSVINAMTVKLGQVAH